jgi:hypothetical protein
MNTNVGDMPLDIFSDYVSDCLGEDWSWEYIIPILNGYIPPAFLDVGHGVGYGVGGDTASWFLVYGNGYHIGSPHGMPNAYVRIFAYGFGPFYYNHLMNYGNGNIKR